MLRVLENSRNLLSRFPQLSQKPRRIKVSCPCLQQHPDKRGHMTRIVIQYRTFVTCGCTNEASIRKNETTTALSLIRKPLSMICLNHPVWLKRVRVVRRWSPPRPTLIQKIKKQKKWFQPVILLPLHQSQGATKLPTPSPKIYQGASRTLRAGQITCVA